MPWKDQIDGYKNCLGFLQKIQREQYASPRPLVPSAAPHLPRHDSVADSTSGQSQLNSDLNASSKPKNTRITSIGAEGDMDGRGVAGVAGARGTRGGGVRGGRPSRGVRGVRSGRSRSGSQRNRKRQRRRHGRGRRGRVETEALVKPFLCSRIVPAQLPLDETKIGWNQDCLSLFTHDIQERSASLREGREGGGGGGGVADDEILDSTTDQQGEERGTEEGDGSKAPLPDAATASVGAPRHRWRRIPQGFSNCGVIVKKWKGMSRGLLSQHSNAASTTTTTSATQQGGGGLSASASGDQGQRNGDATTTGASSVNGTAPSAGSSVSARAPGLVDSRISSPGERLRATLLEFVSPFPKVREAGTSAEDTRWLSSGPLVPPPQNPPASNDISSKLEVSATPYDMPSWDQDPVRTKLKLMQLQLDEEREGRDGDEMALHHLWRRQELSLLRPPEETQLSALQEVYRQKHQRDRLAAQRARLVSGPRVPVGKKRNRAEASPAMTGGILTAEVLPSARPRRILLPTDLILSADAPVVVKRAKLNDGTAVARRTV